LAAHPRTPDAVALTSILRLSGCLLELRDRHGGRAHRQCGNGRRGLDGQPAFRDISYAAAHGAVREAPQSLERVD